MSPDCKQLLELALENPAEVGVTAARQEQVRLGGGGGGVCGWWLQPDPALHSGLALLYLHGVKVLHRTTLPATLH